MANETHLTIVGNLTADPDLRYTQDGKPVANITIASTPRAYDRNRGGYVDKDPIFMRGSVWGDMAHNLSGSLRKGMRVIAQGRLKSRTFTTKQGENRTVIELDVEEIGPSLRFVSVQASQGHRSGPPPQGWQSPQQQGQQWGQQPTGVQQEPPF